MTQKSRLTVDVPKVLIDLWKVKAINNGCSLKDFVLDRMPKIEEETKSLDDTFRESTDKLITKYQPLLVRMKDK